AYSFFFQAEDGIRDLTVTGVQTCALPISKRILAAGCAGKLDADDAVSVLPQPLDDAGNRARLARIHGCAADYDDARARFHRRREIGRASCRERVWVRAGAVASQEEMRCWE